MNRERTCIGCRAKRSKESLLRVVRMQDGTVRVDGAGRRPGRGAYVCSAECLGKAVESGGLARALRTRVPADVCERLKEDAASFAEDVFAKGSKE